MILGHWTYTELGALGAFLVLAFVAGIAFTRIGIRRWRKN